MSQTVGCGGDSVAFTQTTVTLLFMSEKTKAKVTYLQITNKNAKVFERHFTDALHGRGIERSMWWRALEYKIQSSNSFFSPQAALANVCLLSRTTVTEAVASARITNAVTYCCSGKNPAC